MNGHGSGPDTVGILGAGKLGTTLARLLVAGGYRTLIASRAEPTFVRLAVGAVAPGTEVVTTGELVQRSDAVVLALPLGALPDLAVSFGPVLTVDATNYWGPVDGPVPDFVDGSVSHSESVRRLLGAPRLVKAFSHLGYHDLDLLAAPPGDPGRVALGVAADEQEDVATVAGIVDRIGFDPVALPSLAAGRALEAGHPVFGQPVTREELLEIIGVATPAAA